MPFSFITNSGNSNFILLGRECFIVAPSVLSSLLYYDRYIKHKKTSKNGMTIILCMLGLLLFTQFWQKATNMGHLVQFSFLLLCIMIMKTSLIFFFPLECQLYLFSSVNCCQMLSLIFIKNVNYISTDGPCQQSK